MKYTSIPFLFVLCLLAGPASIQATGILWAMQAIVPPGTNDTQVTETVTPPEPAGAETPAAAGTTVVTGNLVQVAPTTGGPSATGAGGGPPIGPDGRTPVLPPGVPFGPAGPGATRAPAQLPGAGPLSPGGGNARATQAPGAVAPPTGTAPSARGNAGTASGKEAPARNDGPVCNVTLTVARTSLSYAGGEFTVASAVAPAGCAPSVAPGAPWIRIVDPAALRFTAEPNTTGAIRDAVVTIGDATFFVRQEHPSRAGFAAAPGRLVFGLDKKGKADKKRITAWSEQWTGTFHARAGHSWLSVQARKPQPKRKRQAYEVTVQRNSGLGPGRHDTFVELTPSGSGASLRIPVVVEVPGMP